MPPRDPTYKGITRKERALLTALSRGQELKRRTLKWLWLGNNKKRPNRNPDLCEFTVQIFDTNRVKFGGDGQTFFERTYKQSTINSLRQRGYLDRQVIPGITAAGREVLTLTDRYGRWLPKETP